MYTQIRPCSIVWLREIHLLFLKRRDRVSIVHNNLHIPPLHILSFDILRMFYADAITERHYLSGMQHFASVSKRVHARKKYVEFVSALLLEYNEAFKTKN